MRYLEEWQPQMMNKTDYREGPCQKKISHDWGKDALSALVVL